MEKETFSDYDITKAMAFLNLSHPLKWDIPLNSVSPSDFLTVGLREAERQVIIGSNEWEQRLFMELIFLEALRGSNLKMWQEKQIDGGESPFRGKVDFADTGYFPNSDKVPKFNRFFMVLVTNQIFCQQGSCVNENHFCSE